MYHKYDELKITDFTPSNVSKFYSQGYKFTRIALGVMQSTKNLRIDLSRFELSSENRRILRKNNDLKIRLFPLPFQSYDWRIAKLCKDFYHEKFKSKIFSSFKAKELFLGKMNLNGALEYKVNEEIVGYCLVYYNDEILHYCYPFYDLKFVNSSLGIGMMTMAINLAKANGCKFVYLGGINNDKDRYKLQFKGAECWNNEKGIWERA